MALNPPLLSGGLPMGIVGEFYCLERRGVGLEVTAPGRKWTANGTVYMTSVRLCLVFDRPQGDVSAIDVPLQGLKGDPEFKQPIFGCNRLEAKVQPVPGRGLDNTSDILFSISFLNGGAGTFLRVLFTLIEQYRKADFNARQAFLQPQRMQNWMHSLMGAQDPSDPSVLYLSQPAAVQQQQQQYQTQPTMVAMPPSAGMPASQPAAGPSNGAAPAVNPAYLAALQASQAPQPQPQPQAGAAYPPPPGMGGPQYGAPQAGYGYPPQQQQGPYGYGPAPGPGGRAAGPGYYPPPGPQQGMPPAQYAPLATAPVIRYF